MLSGNERELLFAQHLPFSLYTNNYKFFMFISELFAFQVYASALFMSMVPRPSAP